MRRDPGYLNVVAGVAEPGGRTPLRPARRLNEAEKKDLVQRLRDRGWSYRRISDELDISYGLVSRWLDATVAADPVPVLPPIPRRPAKAPAPKAMMPPQAMMPRPPPPAPAPEPVWPREPAGIVPDQTTAHLIAQNQRLLDRVEALMAANATQTQAIDALEERLVAAMDERHRRLTDTLLGALKALFGRLRQP
jgi:hypothetical protein